MHPGRGPGHPRGLYARRPRRVRRARIRARARLPRDQALPDAGRDHRRPALPRRRRHARQDHHVHPRRPHPHGERYRLLRLPRRHLQELRHQHARQPHPDRGGRGRRVRPFLPPAASGDRRHHGDGRRPPRHLRRPGPRAGGLPHLRLPGHRDDQPQIRPAHPAVRRVRQDLQLPFRRQAGRLPQREPAARRHRTLHLRPRLPGRRAQRHPRGRPGLGQRGEQHRGGAWTCTSTRRA